MVVLGADEGSLGVGEGSLSVSNFILTWHLVAGPELEVGVWDPGILGAGTTGISRGTGCRWHQALLLLADWCGHDTQVDLWAVGILAFILLCGAHPLDADTDEEVEQLTLVGADCVKYDVSYGSRSFGGGV